MERATSGDKSSDAPVHDYCKLCSELPRGMEGHVQLNLLIEADTAHGMFGSPVFRCDSCGVRWKRRYEGSGSFLWVQFDEANLSNDR
jgi:hypothetical protein